MKYEHLEETLKSSLPINRKERFYTGTVLPALLFHEGLSNLYRFLKAIPGFPSEVNEQTTKDNFLFYTEYSLKESAGKKNVGMEIYTATKDTPDVIIQILNPQTVFVIIESKMFSKIAQVDFNQQMRAQEEAVIDILKKKYNPQYIFHIALLPIKLKLKSDGTYDIINWEFFIDNKELNVKSNYFYPYLQFALNNYGKLVSSDPWVALTVEKKLTGKDIYQDGNSEGTLWVGRKGGAKAIAVDVSKGIWQKKLYGTNKAEPNDGRIGNWISSKAFAEIVDSNKI